jgi:hypothetical protein
MRRNLLRIILELSFMLILLLVLYMEWDKTFIGSIVLFISIFISIFRAEYQDILDVCGGPDYSKGSCSETPKVQNFVQSKDHSKGYAYTKPSIPTPDSLSNSNDIKKRLEEQKLNRELLEKLKGHYDYVIGIRDKGKILYNGWIEGDILKYNPNVSYVKTEDGKGYIFTYSDKEKT